MCFFCVCVYKEQENKNCYEILRVFVCVYYSKNIVANNNLVNIHKITFFLLVCVFKSEINSTQ